jgi:hypothetical protein
MKSARSSPVHLVVVGPVLEAAVVHALDFFVGKGKLLLVTAVAGISGLGVLDHPGRVAIDPIGAENKCFLILTDCTGCGKVAV